MLDNKIETMDRKDLEELQLKKLQTTVTRLYNGVTFYKNHMDAMGLKPEHIKSLKDVANLPFTTKEDFRDTYPYGLCSVPKSEVVRIQSSSGTTGKPIVSCYTKNDLDLWANSVARGLSGIGVTNDDTVQVAFGYGLFTGGLGLHDGAQKLGCTVIPTSSGNTRKQLMLMMDLKTTTLVCTPSYALIIAETAKELGIDLTQSSLKYGMFGAEPWSTNMRTDIENKLGIKAYNIYGLTEMQGPGVAVECTAKAGMHIWEDYFYPEIINPETGEVLPEGSVGELVLTNIAREAQPVLRYRTHDITSITYEKCACGRTHARIAQINGRSDDMIKVKGVKVFPSQIESILLTVPGVEPQYQIVVDRRDGFVCDNIEVRVEVGEAAFTDRMAGLVEIKNKLNAALQSALGIKVDIKLVEPHTISRFEGKSKRIVNRSELGE
ncbi:MAG: phenylacetate--CoA ligase [Dehalococcoidales bacterium]|nr:phenylacetate--CoA ligase [Dehalococcoidales bacterium]